MSRTRAALMTCTAHRPQLVATAPPTILGNAAISSWPLAVSLNALLSCSLALLHLKALTLVHARRNRSSRLHTHSCATWHRALLQSVAAGSRNAHVDEQS